MEKTSKITRTVFKNEWNNPKGGSVFYHDIELENGDKGSIGSKEKEPAKLNPGSELTYTLEAGKIKAVNPNQNGFSGGGGMKKVPANNASFAMAYAKDVLIASWTSQSAMSTVAVPMISTDEMLKLADKMFNWMEGKK